ncbi:hypothetical protein H9657_13315 [Cellulomonas sp. Sa3CUA2]|uniref:Carbohydrate-binding module family 96 domain-containing protein n=1 Tax=Cellulomonas avistercoris TaxID=2762242 RepID=A0ABR8QFP8_9CELL|nr:endo-1,3-alpha-glucanase family glycosylhydrolase [Cellulomonas avistercoris]MBD7919250.1 hypothetical protein [Cellulomonas avistercoris]
MRDRRRTQDRPARPRSTPGRGRTGTRRTLVGALCAVALVVALGRTTDAAVAATTTVSVTASDMTYTNSREPRTALGYKDFAFATRSENSTYVRFATPAAPDARATIESATLVLQARTSSSKDRALLVRTVGASWREATLTHDTRPRATGRPVNTPARVAASTTVRVPVDPAAVHPGGTTAFALSFDRPDPRVSFWSDSRRRARLEVKYRLTGTSATPTQATSAHPTSTSRPAPTATPKATPTPTRTPTSAPTSSPTAAPAPAPTTAPVTGARSDLPYVPATGGAKKVWAHYFPPYPISLDNRPADEDYYTRNYLDPAGEGSKFADVGGLLRDRPLPRSPLSGDWALHDMTAEVEQARSAGIDGFTVNVLGITGANWDRTLDLVEAAERTGGFTVVPNIDTNASGVEAGPTRLAAAIAPLLRSSAAERLPDGRVVLSSFKAEGKSVEWWSELFRTLEQEHGVRVAFTAVLLDSSSANMEAFAPISWALSNWGARNPGKARAAADYAARAHALGVRWMAPVAVQDVRPTQGIYDEAANTETLEATWRNAVDDGADLVQLITWNDYSESTSFAPSAAHGWTFLDVSGYYQSEFKSGAVPTVTQDALYVTHRVHAVDSRVTQQSDLATVRSDANATEPRDTVEVLSFLTAPADVTVTVGGRQQTVRVGAGVSRTTVPLATGEVSAVARRNGATIAHVSSPFTVVSRPEVQDLQYYGVASLRNP